MEDRIDFERRCSCKTRLKGEIEILKKSIDAAKDSEKTPQYTEAALKIAKTLLESGNYTEGCLFIQEAGLPREQCSGLITPAAVEDAERKQDFASCYHLSKLLGKEGDAKNYQEFANHLESPF
jgi:hypothetical protein